MKKTLTVISIALIILSILFAFSIEFLLANYRHSVEKAQFSDQLATLVIERRLLADDYLFNPGERSKTQWFNKYDEAKKLLATHQSQLLTQEEKDLSRAIESGMDASKGIFTSIVSIKEQNGDSEAVRREKESRLVGQLTVKAQETIALANQQAKNNREKANDTLGNVITLLSIAAALFFILLVGSLKVVWQSFNRFQKEKSKNEAILSGIGDAVFAITSDRRIILFNKVCEDLSGWTATEAMGKPYTDVIKFSDENTGKEQHAFIDQALSGNLASMANSTVIIRKDGVKIPVSDSAAPVFDVNNNLEGAVVVFRDVTKEREIDKAKSEFVSLASHQLRTPLTAIRWDIEALLGKQAKDTAKREQVLADIDKSNKRMIELVNALLSVSRIELGTFSITPESIDISALIQETLAELSPLIVKKNIKLVTKLPKKSTKYNVDPQLMGIIVLNFLSNAIKYTPEKGTVTVALDASEKGFTYSVSDTGYGIPKNQQDKIFTKLFRADNVRQTVSDGTGLGLYIVKSIVDTAGGNVGFTSQENKGTNFYVTFPSGGMKSKKGSKTLG